MNDKEFLSWIHARLEHVYGENPLVDYMYKLRSIIQSIPDQYDSRASNQPIDPTKEG